MYYHAAAFTLVINTANKSRLGVLTIFFET